MAKQENKQPIDDTVIENPVIETQEDVTSDDELLSLREEVQAKINQKSESKEKKTYSEEDVQELMSRMQKKFTSMRAGDDEDFVDLLGADNDQGMYIRVPRLNGKFIVGIKDMNTDEYSDNSVYVQNIENPKKAGEMIPWATFIYEDGTTELYPYLSFMNRATGVWAKVLEEKKEDISEVHGTVEVKESDESNEWNQKKTGRRVLAKALKYRTTYHVKEIKNGKELMVSEDVINRVEVPYQELRQYLEANKK